MKYFICEVCLERKLPDESDVVENKCSWCEKTAPCITIEQYSPLDSKPLDSKEGECFDPDCIYMQSDGCSLPHCGRTKRWDN